MRMVINTRGCTPMQPRTMRALLSIAKAAVKHMKITLKPKFTIRIKNKPSFTIKRKAGPCGLCGGKAVARPCQRCHGDGTVRILKRLTIRHLKRHGFEKTGNPVEIMSDEDVCRFLRRWIEVPTHVDPFRGEKAHWEHRMAQAGWWRQPPEWKDVCERHKPAVKENDPPKKIGKKKLILRGR